MSATLTPEELAAFCDAVEWYAINHRDRALSANKFAAQCDLETRWDVVLRILPKIRALAAPAAVPVSELRAWCDDTKERESEHVAVGGCIGSQSIGFLEAVSEIEELIAKHSKEGA